MMQDGNDAPTDLGLSHEELAPPFPPYFPAPLPQSSSPEAQPWAHHRLQSSRMKAFLNANQRHSAAASRDVGLVVINLASACSHALHGPCAKAPR